MNKVERSHFLPKTANERLEGGRRVLGHFKKSSDQYPLVTIVTAVFNGETDLEQTIQTILSQDYPNLEFIVVDGGSTDGTVAILQKYNDRIDYWMSERDQGISDAFNRGVLLSTGDYINFQGDGDGMVSPTSVSDLMKGVDRYKDLLVCGRVNRTDLDGRVLYTSGGESFKRSSLLFRMSLPHQGLFTHIDFFKRYGLFDVKNRYCMDYEHLLRAYREFPQVVKKNVVVANWRADGLGNGRTPEILSEYHRVKRMNQVAHPFVLDVIHSWSKLKYRVKVLLGKDT